MVGLIRDAAVPGIRQAFALFLTHTSTVTPTTGSAEDAHFHVVSFDGTPREGVACKYRADDRVRVDEGGPVIINAPTLSVAYDDVLAVGDKVTDIRDSQGTLLVSDTLYVTRISASAGLGPTLKRRAILSGSAPQRYP